MSSMGCQGCQAGVSFFEQGVSRVSGRGVKGVWGGRGVKGVWGVKVVRGVKGCLGW